MNIVRYNVCWSEHNAFVLASDGILVGIVTGTKLPAESGDAGKIGANIKCRCILDWKLINSFKRCFNVNL